MRRIFTINNGWLCGLLLWAGCSSEGIGFVEPEAATHSVAWLKAQCTGTSALLTSEVVIQGRIVANDAFGEWSRALVLADESGGITLYADAASLAVRYPFGATVRLYANGLRLYDYGGKIVVGAAEPNRYGGFGIPAAAIAAHLHRGADRSDPPVPQTVTIAEIEAAGPARADTYVRLEEVAFDEAGCSWCDRDPETGRLVTTERTLTDAAGHTLVVRTRGGCHYAHEPLPEGKGSVCGIIDWFNGKVTLRIVNREIDFPAPAEVTPAAPSRAYP